ncbi:MAG: site-2 protease family protein [Anaerolineae bacterium]|nr:site-2 protease family protein [Anaerolineae bacterium]
MLDEMSPHDDQLPLADTAGTPAAADQLDESRAAAIRAAVSEVFQIDQAKLNPDGEVAAVFTGRLLLESEAAFARLDERLAPLGLTPVFRERGDQQTIQLLNVRFEPRPRAWWPNAVLFVLTVLSLLYTGAGIALGDAADPAKQLSEFWRGWPYALGLVLILGAHELGHYFAARYHGVPVTLPYFIPLPFGFFGTLGAFIQLRAPMRNRKALLDIGAAGPLAGLVFAVPILLIGLATAEVLPLPTESPFLLEGNSILYAAAKFITFGRVLPGNGADVWMNQLVQAGWTGLFITGLNLIPVGQLDGGHVAYTLLGDRARLLYLPIVGGLAVLAILVSEAWYLWVFLLLFFGRVYATPLDMVTPLDRRRQVIAVVALIVLILVFVPNPLQIVVPPQIGPLDAL